MKQCEQYVRETTTTGMWDCETVTKPKDTSSLELTGAAGRTRNTLLLEDVEEPMPTERFRPTRNHLSRREKRRTFCHCLEMRTWSWNDWNDCYG